MFSALKRLSVGLLILGAAVAMTGCRAGHRSEQPDLQNPQDGLARQMRISALTEFITDPDDPENVRLKAVVEFIDPSGASAQSVGVIRFELYDFYPRSSDPRGKRLMIWPEKDLSDPGRADQYWKALLRGYEFYLPLDPVPGREKKYILEATCIDGQRRLSDLFKLELLP